MRIAHQFGRPDVDAFLNEIDHDQYVAWSDYFAVEPQGWQATQHLIRRVTFFTAQVNSTKRLDERKFELSFVPTDPGAKARAERVRYEAQAVRDEIRDAIEVAHAESHQQP